MDPYQLTEEVLAHGLPFVANYLEELIKQPIIITDCFGYIHYPVPKNNSVPIDDLYIRIPHEMSDQPLYQEEDSVFYYPIGQGNSRAYVVIKNLADSMVSKVISIISAYSLPIKIHFDSLMKIRQSTDLFTNAYIKDLLLNSQLSISSIIKNSNQSLDFDKPYFISMDHIEKSANTPDLRLIKSYTLEYMKKENIHMIPVEIEDTFLAIFPARIKENTLELDPDWPNMTHVTYWKELMEKKFDCVVSCSIGRSYMLTELHKSYNEAQIVLALAEHLGKKGFVKSFTDLGVFTFVFSQDKDTLKEYCMHTFGKLIEYDKQTDGVLFPTLRALIDNRFNRKSTAESLFIHVNTLLYRREKIAQLLKIDLSDMEDQTNLYIAIKVWDTLKTIGFLD